jgi:hypothetical protein
MRSITLSRLRKAIDQRPSAISSSCRYRRMGSHLIIDCLDCPGKQNLACSRCQKAVLQILTRETGVETVVLSALWEISYTGSCVTILKEVAEIAAQCHDLGSEIKAFNHCNDCPLNPPRFYAEVAENLPFLPTNEELRKMALRTPKHGAACKNCLIRIEQQIEEMRRKIEEIGAKVIRQAFRVVENEPEHRN